LSLIDSRIFISLFKLVDVQTVVAGLSDSVYNLWNSLPDNLHSLISFDCFYPRDADAMLARVFATATCPSVYPSRAGIVSKRRKL